MQHHLETFLATAEDEDPTGWGVPYWVERDFRAYLRCGILAHGFARLRCSDCGHDRPVRLCILDLLQRAGELTVTEIYEALGLEQAVCSQHLTVMRDKGILGYRKGRRERVLQHRRRAGLQGPGLHARPGVIRSPARKAPPVLLLRAQPASPPPLSLPCWQRRCPKQSYRPSSDDALRVPRSVAI